MKMKRRGFMGRMAAGAGLAALVSSVKTWAAGLPSDPGPAKGPAGPAEIILPAFEKNLGLTLEQALLRRKTDRKFDPAKALGLEQVSRLCWAACGVNRSNGHRTTPSAMAWYPVEVYLTLPQGAYRFELKEHKLKQVSNVDLRGQVALQAELKRAGLQFLYVVNLDKIPNDSAWMADLEIGCMVQNVYLEAAALGLGACVFALVQYDKVTGALGLKRSQKLRIAQAVGQLG